MRLLTPGDEKLTSASKKPARAVRGIGGAKGGHGDDDGDDHVVTVFNGPVFHPGTDTAYLKFLTIVTTLHPHISQHTSASKRTARAVRDVSSDGDGHGHGDSSLTGSHTATITPGLDTPSPDAQIAARDETTTTTRTRKHGHSLPESLVSYLATHIETQRPIPSQSDRPMPASLSSLIHGRHKHTSTAPVARDVAVESVSRSPRPSVVWSVDEGLQEEARATRAVRDVGGAVGGDGDDDGDDYGNDDVDDDVDTQSVTVTIVSTDTVAAVTVIKGPVLNTVDTDTANTLTTLIKARADDPLQAQTTSTKRKYHY